MSKAYKVALLAIYLKLGMPFLNNNSLTLASSLTCTRRVSHKQASFLLYFLRTASSLQPVAIILLFGSSKDHSQCLIEVSLSVPRSAVALGTPGRAEREHSTPVTKQALLTRL